MSREKLDALMQFLRQMTQEPVNHSDLAATDRIGLKESLWVLDCIDPSSAAIEVNQGRPLIDGSTMRNRMLPRRRALIVAVCFFLASSVAAGAWIALTQDVILSDRFNDGWFDSSKWKSPPAEIEDGGVREESGYLRLINRGYLIPQQPIAPPYELVFEWKWDQIGLKPANSDQLTIALRTSSRPDPEDFFEVDDGLRLKINAFAGSVQLSNSKQEVLATTKTPGNGGTIPLPANTWFVVRVRDDGKSIQAFLSPLNAPDTKNVPLINFETTMKSGQGFCIYNREIQNNFQESLIRNLVVKRLENGE